MLVKEFKVVLPLTVEEYQVAQLYSVAEASKNETGGGEGIEVLKNEPYTDYPLLGGRYNSGQYTYKIYHLKSKVPSFIRILAPEGSLEVHEEAWNAYPYCKTVITVSETEEPLVDDFINCKTNPGYMKEAFHITIETLHATGKGELQNNPGYMKNKFSITVESMHLAGSNTTDNAHELTGERLKLREVVLIDIANDPVKSADYKPTEDPTKFKSQTTGRGPLVGSDWQQKVDPVMTCYKLVTCEFKWFGLQTRVEKFIQDAERRLFTNFHRQVFCWMDRWHGMTIEDIRRLEDKTKEELSKQITQGQVRGMKAE